MRRSFRHYLKLVAILVWVCSVGEPAMAGNVKAQPDLTITLNVYNWAHVDSDTLNRAKQEAARIYRQIGIQTVWIDHSVDEQQQNSASHRASEIYVNIIPQATEGLGLTPSALGVTPGKGRNRGRLYVCLDRVEWLYRKQMADTARREVSRGATIPQILGYAMAHEIGHLLGLEAHAKLGIMRAVWTATDLLNVAYGNLAFSPEQGAVIRSEVELRQ
jgi:hypothetical protein